MALHRSQQRIYIGILLFFMASCGHLEQYRNIFFYNESSGIASTDPAFAKNQSIMWVVHQLYSTLVEVDVNLNIKPLLAKSWTFSEDKKSIQFVLRNDVKFHDDACFKNGKGRVLTAFDVEYSFNRIIDPKTASPGAWIFSGRVDAVMPFKALNDSVFVLNMQKPFQPMLGILSMQYASVIPHEAIESYGNEFRSHPVGSGPFQFVAWEDGESMVLTKNNNYFEKDSFGNSLPYLNGIHITFMDSKSSEYLQFQQGKIDFINDIDPSFKDELLTRKGDLKVEWNEKIILQKHSYLNVEYLGILMDTTNPIIQYSPLKAKKIRQAINYAIDKRKLVFYLRNSIGFPAENGFVPQGMPSFDTMVKGYVYDPVKARQLLKEAGYSASTPVTLLTIPQYANLGAYIASELKQCGIEVKVDVIQKVVLLELTSKSKASFFRGSWIADYPDAENYFSVFYSKNPAPPNYTRYHNLIFDSLYEKALTITNDSDRYVLYHQMDRIIIDDAPVVPLWYDMVLHLVQKNISGMPANSLNMLELRYVRKS